MTHLDYSTIHHNSASPKAKDFFRAIHDCDLITAVEVLETAGYTDTLTQVFLIGWLTPSSRTGGGSDA